MGAPTDSFEFVDSERFEYHFDIGKNRDGRRVIALYMRVAGGKVWHPTIEMDIDFETFFKDGNSDLDPPGTRSGNSGR